MFEVGRYYKVKMWLGEDDGIAEYGTAKVIEVSMPLIKLQSHSFVGGKEAIINTGSHVFISAELVDE